MKRSMGTEESGGGGICSFQGQMCLRLTLSTKVTGGRT